MPTFTQFCNFERAIGKISVFQIAAQAFEAGDFLYIFFKVLGFLRLALFKKISLIKKKLRNSCPRHSPSPSLL